jgi:hypothetical protein
MNKRILVTGGAGFLRLTFCEALLKKDMKSLCRHFFTGRRAMSPLTTNPLFEICATMSPSTVCEVDEIYKPRLSGITPLPVRPGADHKTSVHGAINMLGLANA